jgi:hypothetical protein
MVLWAAAGYPGTQYCCSWPVARHKQPLPGRNACLNTCHMAYRMWRCHCCQVTALTAAYESESTICQSHTKFAGANALAHLYTYGLEGAYRTVRAELYTASVGACKYCAALADCGLSGVWFMLSDKSWPAILQFMGSLALMLMLAGCCQQAIGCRG